MNQHGKTNLMIVKLLQHHLHIYQDSVNTVSSHFTSQYHIWQQLEPCDCYHQFELHMVGTGLPSRQLLIIMLIKTSSAVDFLGLYDFEDILEYNTT